MARKALMIKCAKPKSILKPRTIPVAHAVEEFMVS